MRKFFIFCILGIFSIFNLFAQEKSQDSTKYWDFGLISTFSYNQTTLKYWTAGGDNTVMIAGLLNSHLNYKKDNVLWNNTLDLAYGLQKIENTPFRKNNDKILFSSKFGYNIARKKLYISTLFSFQSQFTKGFEYKDNGDSSLISQFMAPAYLIYSLGLDYKPKDFVSLYVSPLTGKTTIVKNDSLASIGAFGVDTGKTVRYEFGSYLKLAFDKDITKNIAITSDITLFSNYLHNPQNIDVNFNFLLSAKLTKYLSVNFSNQMIYDDDILIVVDADTGRKGKRLQMKNVLGLGFVFKW